MIIICLRARFLFLCLHPLDPLQDHGGGGGDVEQDDGIAEETALPGECPSLTPG